MNTLFFIIWLSEVSFLSNFIHFFYFLYFLLLIFPFSVSFSSSIASLYRWLDCQYLWPQMTISKQTMTLNKLLMGRKRDLVDEILWMKIIKLNWWMKMTKLNSWECLWLIGNRYDDYNYYQIILEVPTSCIYNSFSIIT